MIPNKVWILEFDNGALAVYTEPKEGAIQYNKDVPYVPMSLQEYMQNDRDYIRKKRL